MRLVICDISVDPNFLEGMKKVFTSGEAKDLVDPYLAFSFAGVKVSFGQYMHCRRRREEKKEFIKPYVYLTDTRLRYIESARGKLPVGRPTCKSIA